MSRRRNRATNARRVLSYSSTTSESAQPENSMQPIKPELYEPANANGPTILPFSKCTAVRTPPASRFKRISLAQPGPDFAPPTVNGMEGSFKLSNIAVRNEFRNWSVTIIVASPVGALTARRPRVADSCAVTLLKHETIATRPKYLIPVVTFIV